MIKPNRAARNRIARFVLSVLLIAGCCKLSPVLAAGQGFVVNTTARAPHYFEDGGGFINLLMDEVFRRLQIPHDLIWLPAERSLVFTNNGTVDATVPRAAAIEDNYENMIRVPVEVFRFDFVAFTREPVSGIDDWQGLKPYSVGMINGWKIVENNAADARMISKVNDYEQLLALLDRGRVDVAILDRVMGGWVMKNLGLDLHLVEPPLASVPTYMYLHKKHADLVTRMAVVLAEMKSDGAYAEIHRRALGYDYQP